MKYPNSNLNGWDSSTKPSPNELKWPYYNALEQNALEQNGP